MNGTSRDLKRSTYRFFRYNNEPETKTNPPFVTLPQVTVMLGLIEMFIAGVSFMFAYYRNGSTRFLQGHKDLISM